MSDLISTAGAGLTAIKTAMDVARTIVDARDTSRLLAIKLELQGLLLDAQEAQATLIAEKRELEERVRSYDQWESEKGRYRLTEVVPGGFVYELRPEVAGDEPPHQICAHCYGRRQRSILTKVKIPAGRAEMLRCHACGSEIITKGQDHRPDSPSSVRGFRPLS